MKMCKFFSIVIIIINLGHLKAQVCPENTITTNPDNYQNAFDPNAEKMWDWRAASYQVWLSGFSTIQTVTSPFYDNNTRMNVDHLNDIMKEDLSGPYLDYLPEDGWELLFRNFGTQIQPQNAPYFVLYNRYSGVIRAFVLNPTFSGTANSATLTLKFASNNLHYQTALLNNVGDLTRTCEDFAFDTKKSVLNEFINYPNNSVPDNWLYAEYTTMYDPCTCTLNGKVLELNLEVLPISTGTLSLESFGTITEDILSASGMNGMSSSKISFQDVYGVYQDGLKAYNSGSAFASDLDKTAVDAKNRLGKLLKKDWKNTENVLGRLGKLINIGAPYASAVLTIGSSIVSLIKSKEKFENDLNSVSVNSKIQEMRFKTNGTIVTEIPVGSSTFAVPGSPWATSVADQSKKPIYNNALGVFNLLHKPEVEFTEFLLLNEVDPHGQAIYSRGKEYKLKNEINFALNPHANLQIKDIKFQYVVDLHGEFTSMFESGIIDQNVDWEERMHNLGYLVELLPSGNGAIMPDQYFRVSTPDLSKECFLNYTFKTIGDDFYSFSDPQLPQFDIKNNIKIRVKLILEPINPMPGSNVEEVLLIYSYPVSPVVSDLNITNHYFVENNSHNLYFRGDAFEMNTNYSSIFGSQNSAIISDIPSIVTIEDEAITSDINSLNYVLIGSNVIADNLQYVEVLAGKEIEIKPTNTNEIVFKSELGLIVQDDNQCVSGGGAPADNSIISNFCNTDYLDYLESNRSAILYSEIFNSNEANLSVFPNPSSGMINLSIQGNNFESPVFIKIYDITGKLVESETVSSEKMVTYNLSQYGKGLYLVTINYDGKVENHKVIIE